MTTPDPMTPALQATLDAVVLTPSGDKFQVLFVFHFKLLFAVYVCIIANWALMVNQKKNPAQGRVLLVKSTTF